jgi:hypothetical protein
MGKLTARELQWQTQDDARILSKYQEIMSDSKRRKAAQKQALVEAQRLEKQANNMKLASGGKLKK